MSKGLFITFEGIDGCGKSTQLKMTSERFEKDGREVMVVREPGGTVIGEKIRGVLLDRKNDSMVPMAELFLYEAARAQITEEKIRPFIDKGGIVLCDRFYDSTTAYQGYARELGSDITDTLNKIATGGLEPDVTFVFDIDPEEALRRRMIRAEEPDRLEAMGTAFQVKVREGYLALAKADKTGRVRVIDASGTPDEIFAVVSDVIGKIAGDKN